MSLTTPCQAGFQAQQSIPVGTLVNLTIKATGFQATLGVTTITFTPAAPPTGPILPGGNGTLTAVTIQGPELDAASFAGALATHVASC
jgi:hypothetical protein